MKRWKIILVLFIILIAFSSSVLIGERQMTTGIAIIILMAFSNILFIFKKYEISAIITITIIGIGLFTTLTAVNSIINSTVASFVDNITMTSALIIVFFTLIISINSIMALANTKDGDSTLHIASSAIVYLCAVIILIV